MILSTPFYLLSTAVSATLLVSSNAAYLRRATEEIRKGDPCSQLYGWATCDTLEDLTRAIQDLVPDEGTNLYQDPSQEQIDDWREIVSSMLRADPTCEEIVIPNSLQGKYTTTRFTDKIEGNDYCVLASFKEQFYGEEGTIYSEYPWGTVIVRLRKRAGDPMTKVSIDIPHPLSDGEPWDESSIIQQGVQIFQQSHAKSLILAGSDRYTNGKGENYSKSSCDNRYNKADAAHGDKNMFQASVEEVDRYWKTRGSHTALQFHGMRASTCKGVDAFFSDGNGLSPGTTYVDAFRNNFHDYTSGIDSQRTLIVGETAAGEEPCKMKGTRNIQGRYLNGVSKSKLCTQNEDNNFLYPPEHYDGKFLQIEQISDVRHPNYYEAWANAVASTFPSA